jgi:hypothetical protein
MDENASIILLYVLSEPNLYQLSSLFLARRIYVHRTPPFLPHTRILPEPPVPLQETELLDLWLVACIERPLLHMFDASRPITAHGVSISCERYICAFALEEDDFISRFNTITYCWPIGHEHFCAWFGSVMQSLAKISEFTNTKKTDLGRPILKDVSSSEGQV